MPRRLGAGLDGGGASRPPPPADRESFGAPARRGLNLSCYLHAASRVFFPQSARDSAVPEDWRLRSMARIFKNGDKLDLSNYRPVSPASVPCKAFESLVQDRLIKHLTATFCQIIIAFALRDPATHR